MSFETDSQVPLTTSSTAPLGMLKDSACPVFSSIFPSIVCLPAAMVAVAEVGVTRRASAAALSGRAAWP